MPDCIFCKNLTKVLENDLVYAVYDIKPSSKGHMLFILKRHCPTIFDSTDQERKAIFDLIFQAKELLTKEHQPDGFNILANCGAASGQVVMHAHMHLLPRYNSLRLDRSPI